MQRKLSSKDYNRAILPINIERVDKRYLYSFCRFEIAFGIPSNTFSAANIICNTCKQHKNEKLFQSFGQYPPAVRIYYFTIHPSSFIIRNSLYPHLREELTLLHCARHHTCNRSLFSRSLLHWKVSIEHQGLPLLPSSGNTLCLQEKSHM